MTNDKRQMTHHPLSFPPMKPTSLVPLIALLTIGCTSRPPTTQPAVAKHDDWKPLFNGHDLSGWQKTGTAEWRVDQPEGLPPTLVGSQDGDPKRAGNLSTVDQFQNFELELEFMIDEHGKYNSGVYLRN